MGGPTANGERLHTARALMLSLHRQNGYRERYRAMRPGWRTSGEVYEARVRQYVCPTSAETALSVLDLGCGAGGVMELFSREVALSVGIDPHLPSLLESRDAFIRRVNGSVERLPFQPESFDLIVSSWVLEHLDEPERAFAEISRVLKPRGHFVFLTPNARNLVTLLNRLVPYLAQARLVRALYGREERDTFRVAYRANTLEKLEALAVRAGLERVHLQMVHDPTYLAFNALLFRASALIERWTPASRAVHIVGDFVRGG